MTFFEWLKALVPALAITLPSFVGAPGPSLGSATVSSGFNFPTSSYSFSDADVINAGDFNNVLTAIGITTATDTVSVSGRVNNLSSTVTNLPRISSINNATSASHIITGGGPVSVSVASSTDKSTTTISCPTCQTETTTINNAAGPKFNFTIATTSGNPSITSTTGNGSSTITFTVPSGTSGGGNPLTTGNTPTVASQTSTNTYAFTGATTSLVIPANVTSVIISVIGATGGSATTTGGKATGTLALSGGATLTICVGGSPTSTSGGFCGGGGSSGNGMAGGGMSWVSTSSLFATTTVAIVAGGSGGLGGNQSAGGCATCSGAGGGNSGGSGSAGNGGGTQSAGGAGNGGGTAGSAGQGGTGGSGNTYQGGGGGGGYFGGGGGTQSATGGSSGSGGSGYVHSLLTNTSVSTGTAPSGAGAVSISYLATSSIVGTNYAGVVTSGANQTQFTLTFNNASFVSGVSCGVTPNNATNTHYISYTATSSFTVNFLNPIGSSQSFNYWCLGY